MHDPVSGEHLSSTSSAIHHALVSTFGRPGSTARTVDVLRNGNQIFPSMLEAIGSAESTIEFATFVYWQGDIAERFAHSLAERAAAGVEVRVLIDAFGGHRMRQHLRRIMIDRGCVVADFNPWNWRRPWRAGHRSHRKTLIVDDSIAFTGGVGIASEWEGDASDPSEWRDSHFRFTGEVVTGLRSTFIDNWLDTTGDHPLRLVREPVAHEPGEIPTFVVDADHSDSRNDIHDHFRLLIGCASETIRLTTAYFVPDETIVDDLIEAARRGVDVELLLPGPHIDKNFVRLAGRQTMERLADGGVRVSTYQRTMLHAKVLTIDGEVASIGSANVNRRSGHHDQEANVVIFSDEVARCLDAHFDDDLRSAIAYADDDIADVGTIRGLAEDGIRRFRPWM